MPEVSAIRKVIVCLFLFGAALTLAGHKYQAHRSAGKITWHDVNVEMQNVENARVDLFDVLNAKMATRR